MCSGMPLGDGSVARTGNEMHYLTGHVEILHRTIKVAWHLLSHLKTLEAILIRLLFKIYKGITREFVIAMENHYGKAI